MHARGETPEDREERWARETHQLWTIDSVLIRLVGEAGRAKLAAKRIRDGCYTEERFDETIGLVLDTRKGRREIYTNGATIAPGVFYNSHYDRSYATSGGEGVRVGFDPCVRVVGQVLPHDIVIGLVGLHVHKVVDHPALDIPGLVITAAFVDTVGGEPSGFSLIVGEAKEAVEMTGDPQAV